jgi:predicted amidohydrolase
VTIDELSAFGDRGPGWGFDIHVSINNFVPNPSPRKIRAFSMRNSGAELALYSAAWPGPMGTAASARIQRLQRVDRKAAPRAWAAYMSAA